jgi:hypothetical protein
VQGGEVSPVLANVFLHYVLDIWVAKVVKRPCRGDACLMRYADDCVCAFEAQADAERFYNVLGRRLETFGLELSGAKTRSIPFSRYRQAGKMRFEFLGFEFRWGKDRKGQDHRKRRTARKKLRSALKRFTAWCKEHRHLRLPVLFQRLNAKLRGYYNYYGVHGNAASLQEFFNKARRMLLKWLNRRSQRHSYTWQGYNNVLERFKVARPRIVGRPKTRQAALTTSADLRKRVLLKSPVRANRTPGSVRGRSGNRPSYRDALTENSMATDKPHIDPYLFERQFAAFRAFVEEQAHVPFVSFASHPYTEEQEGYKYQIHRAARDALAFQAWKKSDIGSGEILAATIESIEIPDNNLVPWQGRFGKEARPHQPLYEAQSDQNKIQ